MNGGSNYLPWIILAVTVLASLAWKGYLKPISGLLKPTQYAPARVVGDTANASSPVITQGTPSPGLTMSSHELGALFVQAAKAEAEREHFAKVAAEARDQIKATFLAPFLSPAPAAAGPDPQPAAPAQP